MKSTPNQFESLFDEQMKLIQNNLASGASTEQLQEVLDQIGHQYDRSFGQSDGTSLDQSAARAALKGLLDAVWDNTREAMLWLDAGFDVVRTNQLAIDRLGLPSDPVAPLHLPLFLIEQYDTLNTQPMTLQLAQSPAKLASDGRAEVTIEVGEGELLSMQIHRVTLGDELTNYLAFVRTVDQEASDSRQGQRNKLLATVFENAKEGVVILDLDGKVREANPEFCRISGKSTEQLIGQCLSNFASWEFLEFRNLLASAKQLEPSAGRVRILTAANGRDQETTVQLKRRSIYWGSLSLSSNDQGDPENLICMLSDITEIEETQQRLHRLALHDNLTGLPNRRFFTEQIEALICQSNQHQNRFGVCFLDLDDFKIVNDTLGHDAGDQLLMAVAERIKGCIYRDCFLARFGGDEFALLIPEQGDEYRIGNIASKVVDVLNEPFPLGENNVYIGVSIGITMYPDDSTEVNQLLRHADVAMYHAKDEGKNTVRGFTPLLAAKIEANQRLLNQLRNAVANNDVTLAFQPKLCLKTNQLCGCEALVRWTKDDGIPESPGSFIDVAEKSGLILPLGDQIIEMSMRQAKAWHDSGEFVGTIAINLSPRQLCDPDFVGRFKELLKKTGAKPAWIELEITENAMMDSLESAMKLMDSLVEIGVKIAIDDFGTGYSSLNYLKSFPVSTLKIDLSFVRDLPDDPRAVAVAKTILSLGHGLGIDVVAEGVETEGQRKFLEESGCNSIQGFLVNRPLPADEFAAWAAHYNS